ncbi:MAG: sulfotransferase [Gammaproteobacteria bacterium]|nr:sulfotransferase [Gammaproteobacteria bacterium]
MSVWPANVTVEALEADAIAATGLEDFGGTEYREGLSVLLGDYRRHAHFDAAGAAGARAMLMGVLVQRLKAQHSLRQTRRARIPVRRPWLILSMPRSGTTALHRLLAADPTAQGLEHWLGLFPQPRPPAATWSAHPDFQATAAALAGMRAASPEIFALHAMTADEVDECRLLLMQSFANMSFFQNAVAPDYEAWHWQCDMRAAYARHRALLELIDGGAGRRWVLKDPSHLMSLEALSREYPDMRVICTRRPAEVFLPSVAALVLAARRLNEPEASPEEIGRLQLALWSRCAHELQEWRAAHPEIPWCDVDHEALRREPLAAIGAIYEAFGEPLGDEAAAAIRARAARLEAGASTQQLTLEDFGLSRRAVRIAFPEEFV